MYDSVLDAALEAMFVLAEIVGTGLAIALGVAGEEASLSAFAAGETILGLWFAYIGTLALFVGVYLLGYRALFERVVRARA
ncbi:hypothetical protein BRD01_11190 [Halobacteriales archaeon QS_8_65_32]|nr:MAG: hypothetical protein BRD01_11190 [Halobacteriales archaeon QS_8_65_32]